MLVLFCLGKISVVNVLLIYVDFDLIYFYIKHFECVWKRGLFGVPLTESISKYCSISLFLNLEGYIANLSKDSFIAQPFQQLVIS